MRFTDSVVKNSLTISNQRFTRDQLESSGWVFVADENNHDNAGEYYSFTYQNGNITFIDKWFVTRNHFLIYIDDKSNEANNYILEINVLEDLVIKNNRYLYASVKLYDGPDDEYPMNFPVTTSTRFVLTVSNEELSDIASSNLHYEIYSDSLHRPGLLYPIISRLECRGSIRMDRYS